MGFFSLPGGGDDPAKISQLLELVASNEYSFSQIATIMGAGSRNVVLCKFNRLRDKDSSLEHPGAPKGESINRVARVRPATLPTKVREIVERPQATEPLDIDGVPITLMNLTSSMCNYPIGDPGDDNFRFCGHPKKQLSEKVKSAYCDTHHALCRVAPTNRTKAHVGKQR